MILLLLLLGVVPSTLSAGCPPDEDINPCICEDDDFDVSLTLMCAEESVSLNDLKKILSAFDNQSTLAIELDGVNLGTVPSNFFHGLKVKRLEISNCQLDVLTEGGGRALAGLEDTLEELIIASTFTDDNALTKLDLGHLRHLYQIDLSFNSIAELGNDWFENGPVSLNNLVLTNNGIQKLGDRAFANLVNLRALHLNGNRFRSIKRSMLPSPANTLDDLQLDNNALTSLPEDIFSGMPTLTIISLRTNGLTKIPKETFEPVWQQLELIDFRENNLECDSHIEWMFQLKTLANVYGECFSPPERKGIELEDLITKGSL